LRAGAWVAGLILGLCLVASDIQAALMAAIALVGMVGGGSDALPPSQPARVHQKRVEITPGVEEVPVVEEFLAVPHGGLATHSIFLPDELLSVVRTTFKAGSRINIFGNQAYQMVLSDEESVAVTGGLVDGDIDFELDNDETGRIDDELEALQARFGTERLHQQESGEFQKLVEGPFTVNRVVISITALGNGQLHVGFGRSTDDTSISDLRRRRIVLQRGYDSLTPSRAFQALIYARRRGMTFSPFDLTTIEAVRSALKEVPEKGLRANRLGSCPAL
jgi:hypothetical protein